MISENIPRLNSEFLRYIVEKNVAHLTQQEIASGIKIPVEKLSHYYRDQNASKSTLRRIAVFLFKDFSEVEQKGKTTDFITSYFFLKRCIEGKDSINADPPKMARKFLIATKRLTDAGSVIDRTEASKDDLISIISGDEFQRSDGAEAQSIIVFHNISQKELSVYWVDYAGMEKLYFKLAPGQKFGQQTFMNHVWIARTSVTKIKICTITIKNETEFLSIDDEMVDIFL